MISQPSSSRSSRSLDTSSKRSLRDPEKGSSLFLLLVAFFVLAGSVTLGLGTFGSPGPGFLPFLAAGVLACSSGIHFLSEMFSRADRSNKKAQTLWAGTKWTKVICVAFVLILYAFCFETAGFILCTFLLMAFLLLVMDIRSAYTVLIGSLLVTLMSYIIFEKLLNIGFPAGILRF